MSLSEFIVTSREPILVEWEAFARTCAPASGTMDVAALRDHASQMLSVIAADLDTPQGDYAQSQKSKGLSPPDTVAAPTAAEEHGAGRAESGFTVEQMVAEYRALRASVIRLWTRAKGELVPADVVELTRFNEAIDQALAESVTRYSQNLEQSKEIFLGILGHDMRTPLGAISTSARFMLDLNELAEPHLSLTRRIGDSADRTLNMVADLLDFTRGRLGGGIPVKLAPANLGRIVHDAVDEICAADPACRIEIRSRGNLDGAFDGDRISQALSNLIVNAVQHGATGSPITVDVAGEEDDVTVCVHNWGPAILPSQLDGLFNAMKARGSSRTATHGRSSSLGLGLYISQQVVSAHRGHITVASSDAEGTVFTVQLPRQA